MDLIKTDDLTKYYGKIRGIEHIDLTIRQGDFFGFIGPNGAGKSTTIRTLLGLIYPSAGTANIFGMDTIKEREKILSRVGYLPSEAAFYHGMRVHDILELSSGLRNKDCRNTAKDLCERLQLDTARRIDELSFGNRKKVAIICALQHEPDLLILDEPTGGLDPLMQREFFDILRERNKQGTTVFLSSHILSEIQHNCTHAAIIRDGKIIADGSVKELSRTGAKRVSIHGYMDYGDLNGIKDMHITPESIDFLYSGDVQELLSVAARGKIQDISITEPDMEEIFMHYYQEGGNKNDHLQA